MVVAPNNAASLINNVNYLKDSGFNKISLDYASGLVWDNHSIEKFEKNIQELAELKLGILNYNKIDLLLCFINFAFKKVCWIRQF